MRALNFDDVDGGYVADQQAPYALPPCSKRRREVAVVQQRQQQEEQQHDPSLLPVAPSQDLEPHQQGEQLQHQEHQQLREISAPQLVNKIDLTPKVAQSLSQMEEHVTQINVDLNDMERAVMEYLDRLKEEWRDKIQGVRHQVEQFYSDSAQELCRLSDEARDSAHRRELLVVATAGLGSRVDVVSQGGGSALMQFPAGTGSY